MFMLRYADCLKDRREKKMLTNKAVTKEKQKKNLVVVSTWNKKRISDFIMWKFETYLFHRTLAGMRSDIVCIQLQLITVSNFKRETEMIAFWSAFFCCCCCSSSWKFIESTEAGGWMASRKNRVGVTCKCPLLKSLLHAQTAQELKIHSSTISNPVMCNNRKITQHITATVAGFLRAKATKCGWSVMKEWHCRLCHESAAMMMMIIIRLKYRGWLLCAHTKCGSHNVTTATYK